MGIFQTNDMNSQVGRLSTPSAHIHPYKQMYVLYKLDLHSFDSCAKIQIWDHETTDHLGYPTSKMWFYQ